MMPPVFRLPLLVLLGLALAAGGCTKQARMERKLAKGNKYVEAGDFKRAEVEYRGALLLVPENSKVLARVGIMIYHQGRPLSAYYMLDGIRGEFPNDLDVQLAYGLSCLSLARTADARIAAKKVLEGRPDSEDALLMLVDSCLTTRDNEEAQRLIEQYMGRSGGNTSGHHVALGALQLARRQPKAAEVEFRKALEINPKSASAYAYLGGMALAEDKMEEAEKNLKLGSDLSPLRAPRRIKYIDLLMKKGAYDEARQELAKILDPAPDYVPAWGLKMKIAFLQEKYEESDAAVSEILVRDRVNFEAMMQRAAIKLLKADYEGVIKELKAVEGFYERSPQVKYQLALAYLKYGNPGRAEDYLQMALRLSPNYDDAAMLLADVNLQKGNPAGTIAILQRMLTRRPSARGYVLLAQAYKAQGNLPKCLELLQALSTGLSKVPDGPYLVGTILVEMGRAKEAREAFEQALSRAGNYWPAVEGLVDLDLLEQKLPAAAERVSALLEKNPGIVPLWLMRAKIRLPAGDVTGAESDLLKAIELDPKAQYPYLLLTRIYFHTDRAREALDKLTVLAGQKPVAQIFMQLGMLHEVVKHTDEARANYEKALALDPTFTPALNNLAFLYSQNPALLDKALDLAKQAQTQRPNDPVVADTFGWILFRKGQYDRALRFSQQAVEKIPADPEIKYRLGMIQYYLGQLESARQAFLVAGAGLADSPMKDDAVRRLTVLATDPANPAPAVRAVLEEAVAQDPTDPVALIRLAQVETRVGQFREAADHYEAVLKVNPAVVPAMMALVELDFGPVAKPERARELAKLIRAGAPNDQPLAAQLGHLLVEAGDFTSAALLLVDAARAFPERMDVQFDLARSYYGSGRVPEAEKALEAALAADNKSPASKPVARMAALLAAARQPVLSPADLALAREALTEESANVPALVILALDQEQQKDYRGAVAAYGQVLKANPGFAPAMRQLAMLYGEQLGDDEKAEQFATKAKQTLTEDPDVDFELGVINYRRGGYADSARFLQLSLRKRPNHAITLFFLGMAHFQLKNPSEAKLELQRALELKLPPQEDTEARRVVEMINRTGGG